MSAHPDLIKVSTGKPVPADPEPAPVKDNYHPGPDFPWETAA